MATTITSESYNDRLQIIQFAIDGATTVSTVKSYSGLVLAVKLAWDSGGGDIVLTDENGMDLTAGLATFDSVGASTTAYPLDLKNGVPCLGQITGGCGGTCVGTLYVYILRIRE